MDGSHNSEDVHLTPIFPFEDWTLETRDAGMDAVARRTLELASPHRAVLGGATLNTVIRSPIAAVRAGAGEECRLRNPWPNPCRVETSDGRYCKNVSVADEVVRFPTHLGGRYRFLTDGRGIE